MKPVVFNPSLLNPDIHQNIFLVHGSVLCCTEALNVKHDFCELE
jgi:hypothetical protein